MAQKKSVRFQFSTTALSFKNPASGGEVSHLESGLQQLMYGVSNVPAP